MAKRTRRDGRLSQCGQALVETALVVPLLLSLVFGVVGLGRAVQAQMGVLAVAREAALSASLASSPAEAGARGLERGRAVAAGYGLSNGTLALSVYPGDFVRGGAVQAEARYEVRLDDLPLLGWVRFAASSRHVERIDPYRSRW